MTPTYGIEPGNAREGTALGRGGDRTVLGGGGSAASGRGREAAQQRAVGRRPRARFAARRSARTPVGRCRPGQGNAACAPRTATTEVRARLRVVVWPQGRLLPAAAPDARRHRRHEIASRPPNGRAPRRTGEAAAAAPRRTGQG